MAAAVRYSYNTKGDFYEEDYSQIFAAVLKELMTLQAACTGQTRRKGTVTEKSCGAWYAAENVCRV
jgi:hypothetical protein